MILSAQSIISRVRDSRSSLHGGGLDVVPLCPRTVMHGMSYGLSAAGVDLRLKDGVVLMPGDFVLGVTVEKIYLPADLMGQLVDKSSWARRGVAVQNTVFEPGWFGYPTIEISNHGRDAVSIRAGSPIAQMLFHVLDQPTDRPYSGKYQDQPQRPVRAIDEGAQ